MNKPSLTPTALPDLSALPNPYELARHIIAVIRFIDENPDAQLCDLSPLLIHLPMTDEESTSALGLDRLLWENDHNAFWNMFIFANLYLRYYRLEDFADMDNFFTIYDRYQNLLMNFQVYDHHSYPDSIHLRDIQTWA